jgi:hemin uptake protein HemP
MQNDSVRLNAPPENTTSDRRVSIVSGEIDSRELFQGEREIRIRHGADIYRLRLTGLNRLILTK